MILLLPKARNCCIHLQVVLKSHFFFFFFFGKTSFVNPFLFQQSSYSTLPSQTDKDELGANSQDCSLLFCV